MPFLRYGEIKEFLFKLFLIFPVTAILSPMLDTWLDMKVRDAETQSSSSGNMSPDLLNMA
jgi:hypothetical protein